MYKSSINKISRSISKEHTAHLVVTELSPFVSSSAALFFSRVSVARAVDGRPHPSRCSGYNSSMRKKEKLACDSWLQYSEFQVFIFTLSPHIVIFFFFVFVFFFFVTWQRSVISSLYISTPWWWDAKEPPQAIGEQKRGEKRKLFSAATPEILSTSGTGRDGKGGG